MKLLIAPVAGLILLPASASAAVLGLGVQKSQSSAPATWRVQVAVPRGWTGLASGTNAVLSQPISRTCRARLDLRSWDGFTSRPPGDARNFLQGMLQLRKQTQKVSSGTMRQRLNFSSWPVLSLGGWSAYLWQGRDLWAASGYRSSNKALGTWRQTGIIMQSSMSGRCPRTLPSPQTSAAYVVLGSLQLIG